MTWDDTLDDVDPGVDEADSEETVDGLPAVELDEFVAEARLLLALVPSDIGLMLEAELDVVVCDEDETEVPVAVVDKLLAPLALLVTSEAIVLVDVVDGTVLLVEVAKSGLAALVCWTLSTHA